MNLPRFKIVIRDLGLALAASLTLAGCLHEQHQVLSTSDWSPLGDRMGETAKRDWERKASKPVRLAQPTKPEPTKVQPLTPTPQRSTTAVQRHIVAAEPMKPHLLDTLLKSAAPRKATAPATPKHTASVRSKSSADPFLDLKVDHQAPAVASDEADPAPKVPATEEAKTPTAAVARQLPRTVKKSTEAAEVAEDEPPVRASANSPSASLVSTRKTAVSAVTSTTSTGEPAAPPKTGELDVPAAATAVSADALASGPANPLPKKPVRAISSHARATTVPVSTLLDRDPVEMLASPQPAMPAQGNAAPSLVARQASGQQPEAALPAPAQLPVIRPAGSVDLLQPPAAPEATGPAVAQRTVSATPVSTGSSKNPPRLIAPATLPGRIRPQGMAPGNPISFSSIEEVEDLPPSSVGEPQAESTEVAVADTALGGSSLESTQIAANVALSGGAAESSGSEPVAASGTLASSAEGQGPLLTAPPTEGTAAGSAESAPSLGPVPGAPAPVAAMSPLEGPSHAEPFKVADLLKVGARWTTGARIGLGIGITGLLGLVLWRLLDLRRYRNASRR